MATAATTTTDIRFYCETCNCFFYPSLVRNVLEGNRECRQCALGAAGFALEREIASLHSLSKYMRGATVYVLYSDGGIYTSETGSLDRGSMKPYRAALCNRSMLELPLHEVDPGALFTRAVLSEADALAMREKMRQLAGLPPEIECTEEETKQEITVEEVARALGRAFTNNTRIH
jgi:hypothetical protein